MITGGGKRHAKKAVDGLYKKALLQTKDIQMLHCLFCFIDSIAMPEYKADMVFDMGGNTDRDVPPADNRQIYLIWIIRKNK